MLLRPEKGSFKKRKKHRNFPKGLDHSFCQNIELFIICVFLCKSSHKRSFFGLLDKKECFLGQKKEVLKNSSKSKFSKGVCPLILSKIELFIMYYVIWGQIKQEKILFWCSGKKRILFGPEKESFKKVQKIEIFQRGKSMVFVKKSTFLSSVFFGQIKTGKIVFLLFWIKRSFLEQKKEVLKKRKKN